MIITHQYEMNNWSPSFDNPSESGLIIITTHHRNSTVSSLTYGGVEATLIDSNASDWPQCYVFAMLPSNQPTAGIHQVIVDGGDREGSVTFTKLKTNITDITDIASVNNYVSNSSISTSIVLPIEPYFVLDAISFREGVTTNPGTSQTLLSSGIYESPRSYGVSYKEVEGDTVMSWQSSSSNRIRHVVIAIPPSKEYKPQGIWQSQPFALTNITSLESSQIGWGQELPAGTTAVVSTAITDIGVTPTNWIEQSYNAEVQPISSLVADTDYSTKEFHIKVELATTDIEATPEVYGLYFEVSGKIDRQKVTLHFDTFNRFNDAEGDIQVQYTANGGNLTGTRAVASFAEIFTPDVEPTPETKEYLSVAPDVSANFIPIAFKEGYADDEQLSVAPVSVSADLIHINIINP